MPQCSRAALGLRCPNEATDGFRMCSPCREYCRQHAKVCVQRRRDKGLCLRMGCPDPPAVGHVYCTPHLDQVRKDVQERYKRRAELGVCRQCAGPLPQGRGYLCLTCKPAPIHGTWYNTRQRKQAQAEEAKKQAAILAQERQEQLSTLVLSPRDEFILRRLWGLTTSGNVTAKWTLQKIGDDLELSRERVRQIKEKALATGTDQERLVRRERYLHSKDKYKGQFTPESAVEFLSSCGVVLDQ